MLKKYFDQHFLVPEVKKDILAFSNTEAWLHVQLSSAELMSNHKLCVKSDKSIVEMCRSTTIERSPVGSKTLFYTHLGYPLNFIFAFHVQVKGTYLCLAEVKWVRMDGPEGHEQENSHVGRPTKL